MLTATVRRCVRVASRAGVRWQSSAAAASNDETRMPPTSHLHSEDPTWMDVVSTRRKYLSPSLNTFEAYDDPMVITKSEMQYLWDSTGKRFTDLTAQNIVVSIGHGHPKVVQAAVDQMMKMPHASSMYYSEQSAKLAKEIVEKMPAHPSGDDWVIHFVNDGSEAVDLAIQMARVYTGRSEFVALHKAYHGLQGYAAGLTAIGKSTQPCYAGMFNGITHIPPNSMEMLDNYLKYSTGGKVAGIIMEPQQGYGGIFPLDEGYLRESFNRVREHGGVCIADEVQTGYNRCGESFWGFDMKHNQAMPDMVTIAKGMGNGIGIIGAVITTRSIADAFTSKMFFNTYGGNSVACAAARAVLKVMDEEDIQGNCQKMSKIFIDRFTKICEDMPQAFVEIRGSGLFLGLEVAGPTPEESGKNAYEMHRRLREYGIAIGRGSAAGNVFRIQPPMCIGEEDVHNVIDSIEEVAAGFIAERNL